MNKEELTDILKSLVDQEKSIDDVIDELSHLPFKNTHTAKIDFHRDVRTSVPEVIFCEKKTDQDIIQIVEQYFGREEDCLATRLSKETYLRIKYQLPEIGIYHETAKIYQICNKKTEKTKTSVLVVTAGTSDIAVAEEAAIVLDHLGNTVERLYDVGVAGLHRLLNHLEQMRSADVIVVVAGMDGALPSVIGGLVDAPVIGVPTSVGYGTSFNGVAPLLTMLNSCAAGVGVVNIDNGFGAACLAHKINRRL